MRNPMINLFLVFQETSTLAAPAYISTGSVEGLLFLHALLSMLCIDFNIFIPLFLPVLGLVAAWACCGRSELGHSVVAAHGLQHLGRTGSAVGVRGCSCSVAGGTCLLSGVEPASPAWAGGLFTAEPAGKPIYRLFSEALLPWVRW